MTTNQLAEHLEISPEVIEAIRVLLRGARNYGDVLAVAKAAKLPPIALDLMQSEIDPDYPPDDVPGGQEHSMIGAARIAMGKARLADADVMTRHYYNEAVQEGRA